MSSLWWEAGEVMAHITIDLVSTKAQKLGFRFTVLGQGKYRMLFPNTSFGYHGNLDGCMGYLQGWDESAKFEQGHGLR